MIDRGPDSLRAWSIRELRGSGAVGCRYLWKGSPMTKEDIRKAAYARWEMEGKPNGQELRHWLDAERELKARDEDLLKTSSDDHHAGVVPDSGDETHPAPTSSDAIPSREAKPGRFKPGELASENK
ncbi:DUF2934 domain-containing protein [Rhizobium sp. CNPSo 4039]|uniref:DUF2934 domain-containing protein n=1 Tax=Rhizobium sp. CNPSo 4039 TaxID=3021409 RepID=UPI00254FE0DB|nr:DUF2934 domain-containing protein [Rhizobium sp. CNPSo 4039]MDK4715369.1 DUF2934 domain-containing protein [Rhizobium sp. CNPSo 4039]